MEIVLNGGSLEALEQQLLKSDDQLDIEASTTHNFVDGMYIRQLSIPAGAVVVGKRHRHKTLNILLKGKMIINDGVTNFTVEAPYMVESAEYTKKAGYAVEDSIWCNIHVTEETDLEKLEEMFIIPEIEYKNLIGHEEKVWLGDL